MARWDDETAGATGHDPMVRRRLVRQAPMSATLTCAWQAHHPVAVLHLVGGLDTGSAVTVRAALHKALAEQPSAIVVDLADLDVEDDLALTVFTAFARTAATWH